jgi:asparagine N-glycosylation enzyme membrane subunit Stt3
MKQEIDHRTLKLVVAIVAFFLASVTSLLADGGIESISASYKHGGTARDVFVGALFAIAAFMAAYNGFGRTERVLARVVAVAAVGVALFPGGSADDSGMVARVHTIASILMFLSLAGLCQVFRSRALRRNEKSADRRATLYAICALVMLAVMILVVIDHFTGGPIVHRIPRLVFYCEMLALLAFGVAWLAASHILPWFTAREERWI